MHTDNAVRVVSKNLFINVAGAVWQFVLIIVGTKIVLAQLGADSFGLLALIGGTAGYFIYMEIGLSETVIKKVSEAHSTELVSRIVSTLFFFSIGFGILLAALIALFGLYGVDILFSFKPELMQSLAKIFLVIAAGLWVLYPVNIFSKVFAGLQRFDIYNILRVVFQTLILAAIVATLRVWPTAEAAAAAITVVGIIWKFTAWIVLRRLYPDIRISQSLFDKKLLRELLGYKSYATTGQVFAHGITQCDIVMIGILLNPAMIAIYSVANILALKVSEFAGVLATSLFPMLSSLHGENKHEQVQKGMIISLHLIVVALIPVTAFIFFFSGEILNIWIGAEFASSSPALKGLVVARFVNVIFLVVTITLNAVNRPAITALLNGAVLFLNIALDYFLITRYGLMGAVWATLACQLLGTIAVLFIAANSFTVEAKGFLIRFAAIITAGILLSGFYLLPVPPMLFFVPLILHSASFFAVYYFVIVDSENKQYLNNIAAIVLKRER